MADLNRRSILKMFGVAPAMPFAAKAAEMEQAGIGILGQQVGGVIAGSAPTPTISGSGLSFFDFATWFREVGKDRCRQQARETRTLDPDIMAMHLPLTTKLRWQEERSYQRIIAQQKGWFMQRLKECGEVTWWP